MKFEVSVDSLNFWLGRASTGLGSGAANKLTNCFIFRERDERVEIICTNDVSFACVLTNVPIEKGVSSFALSTALLDIVSYSDAETISFELLSSGKVKIKSGSYVGEWIVTKMEELPDIPELVFTPFVDIKNGKQSFIKSAENVVYASEGLLEKERRIVFKDGLCWGGSARRYQEVYSNLSPEVAVIIPYASLNVLKFLKASPSVDFKLVVSTEYTYFFDGADVFICKKAQDSLLDEHNDMTKSLQPKKQIHFIKETALLARAVHRASATCEEKSAEITFELFPKKLVIRGEDKHGNSGVDELKVNFLGNVAALPLKRVVGWTWVVEALKISGEKAVTIVFDEKFLIVETEKTKGIFALVNIYD